MPEINNKENQKDEVGPLKEKLEQAEREKNEYLDGWKRAKADLINYKKEEEKRFEDFAKFSLGVFMKELVAVLDSFDLGLTMLKDDDSARKGLLLIRSKLADILKKFGLEEMRIATGQPFDPSQQEAVAEVDSDQPVGTIIEEAEKGYRLNGRVLRPAKVKVAKGRLDQ